MDLEEGAVRCLLEYLYTGSVEESMLEDDCLAAGSTNPAFVRRA